MRALRSCSCGCGGSTRGPSGFQRGHAMRDPRRRALAVRRAMASHIMNRADRQGIPWERARFEAATILLADPELTVKQVIERLDFRLPQDRAAPYREAAVLLREAA